MTINKVDGNTYISGKKASEILGVHQRTLYRWDDLKLIDVIRMPGGKRLYNVEKFIKEKNLTLNKGDTNIGYDILEKEQEIKDKVKICYARVSSIGQRDDLIRQKDLLKKSFPNHILIDDIGSGVNLNRRGLRRIIKLAIEGKVEELIIVHKDRLTRFGYDLIEDIIKDYSNGKIIILNKKEEMEPEEELVKDVLTIMNVFVARMNGLRKYNKKMVEK